MPDRLLPLTREVERLLTAPYVPALQDFYDIVHRCSPPEIRSWAFCKPCQVGPLGDLLVQALSHSALSLQLLCNFASAPSFRDALLERHPTILDGFLQKAVEDGASEYFPVCAALLSSPLPSDFVVPTRLSPLIMKLVCRMGERRCVETILPLYQVMIGLQASSSILDTLPFETMTTLQMEFTKTLRNFDDHMGNLLCLATFASIASSRRANFDDEYAPQPPSWLQNIRHFFGPKRGLKTLDLVVLRVILSCSATCNSLPVSQAAESIRLAIDICKTVNLEQRQAWIAGNSSKIAKLCEKLTRDGISHEVQAMGVAFLVTFLPAGSSPSQITTLCQQILLSERVLQTIPHELVPRMVEVIAISHGEAAMCGFLNLAFSTIKKDATDCNILASFNLSRLLLSGLQNVKPLLQSPSVHELVMTLGEVTVKELLLSFPRKPQQPGCENSSACYVAISEAQNSLFVDLFGICARSAFPGRIQEGNSGPDNIGNRLAAFMGHLIDLFASSCCSFSASRPLDIHNVFPSLVSRKQPTDNFSTRDWRAKMAETLMLNARTSYDHMLEKVEEICYDLEHRCYNTEAPLRAVQKERDQLMAEANELKQRNEDLQVQLQQASNTISDLRQDIVRLESHAERVSCRSEALSADLDSVRRELESQRHQSEKVVQVERENSRTRELELIATATEREDQIEGLERQLNLQTAENNELQHNLETLSGEHATLMEEAHLLNERVSGLEVSLEEYRLLLAQKDEEAKRSSVNKEHLSLKIRDLEAKLEEKVLEYSTLSSALLAAEEKSRIDMEMLKQEHELAISHASSESSKRSEENKSLQTAMQEAVSNATKELQMKERKIQHLESKVQSLRNERATKAQEFLEAQQHISRLMIVMGFKADPAEAEDSSKRRRSRSHLAMPPKGTNNASFWQTGNIDFNSESFLGESFGSIASNSPGPDPGPSPKRPRDDLVDATTPFPSRAKGTDHFKAQDLQYPRSSAGKRRERQPLGDADPNGTSPAPDTSRFKSRREGSCLGSQLCITTDENGEIDIADDLDIKLDDELTFTSVTFSGNENSS